MIFKLVKMKCAPQFTIQITLRGSNSGLKFSKDKSMGVFYNNLCDSVLGNIFKNGLSQ